MITTGESLKSLPCSESRVWSCTSPKVHLIVPREIVGSMHWLERSSLKFLTRASTIQLRDIWVDLLSKSTRKDEKLSLNTFMWLNKVTLDIIGLAGNSPFSAPSFATLIALCQSPTGFNYPFNSLHSTGEEQNDLYEAIRSILIAPSRSLIHGLQLFFPIFRAIVSIPLIWRGQRELTSFHVANASLSSPRSLFRSSSTYWISTYP